MGRAFNGSLPCLLPIENGVFEKIRFRVMVCQEFRLGFFGLGQLFLHHFGYLTVILLPGTLKQRLIGDILNESMFEEIARLWWCPALVEHFGCNQLCQSLLQVRLLLWEDGLE